MTDMPQSNLGRHVFGTAILASGVVSVVFHHGAMYSYVLFAAQMIGGVAIQFRPSARIAAAVIGAAYLALALLCIPQIVAMPRVYWSWGNFFYPLANVIGAGAAYALLGSTEMPETWLRAGSILFALCNVSFAIEQAEFLARTASLVPTWIPPSQMFWAIATEVPFALVAIALVIDRMSILATRLFAVMFWAFAVLIWVPLTIANPHSHSNWSEGTETVAIGAAAWILAEAIARYDAAA